MWQCLTTIAQYNKSGIRSEDKELPFVKYFKTGKEALEFGKKMFEPPQTVLSWRVQKIIGG